MTTVEQRRAWVSTKVIAGEVEMTEGGRAARPLPADMGIWTEADTNPDAGGHKN